MLYPAEFRHEFGADMLLHFDDLIVNRGAVVATTRTSVDLVVTVPRYHLEAVMNTSSVDRMLGTVVVALPVLGVSSILFGSPWAGAALIGAGVILALASRGRLARSIRTAPPSQRARRLRGSAVSFAVLVTAYIGFVVVTSDEPVSMLGLLVTTLIGVAALGGAAALLVAGLLTPKSEQAIP